MKKFLLSILWCVTLLSSVVVVPEFRIPDPLLAVLIMVKNEETVIRATMEPLIKAGVRHFMILDTGSTDNTIAEVQKTYQDYGIVHGYVVEQPFVDFATSRNYGIDRAEELFPNAGFFLMIDAEWYLQTPETLMPLCAQLYATPYDVFVINVEVGASEVITANRLFKARKGAYFKGAVHEYLALESINVPTAINMKYSPERAGQVKSQERLKRDLEILKAAHEQEPDVVRHVYFIAQTYHCMGDIEAAGEWYMRASDMQGWPEMLYIAKYRAAQCIEMLNVWPLALATYLKAYAMRPTRAEPLMNLAVHYWNTGDSALSYMFAKQAVAIDFPALDSCYVNRHVYDEMRYDILARAAWAIQQYDVGLAALKQGLKNNPSSEGLKLTAQVYEESGIPVSLS